MAVIKGFKQITILKIGGVVVVVVCFENKNTENIQGLPNHYETLSMQYTEIFFTCKKLKISSENFFDIFLIFAHNIDCGYTLEPPRRGGSHEYPQSMLWKKNKKKKNRYTPANPSFSI